MVERMTRTLVMDALRIAWFRRHPTPSLILYSDCGSQHASNYHRQLLQEFKMESLMSRRGDCWDNVAIRITEGGTAPGHVLRHVTSSQGRGHGLNCLLQSSAATFDDGLCQPHDVRTKMACQPNQSRSIVIASRETLSANKASTHQSRPVAKFQNGVRIV